ncbi:MAG TPA: glycosyltransferase family 4 protein [Mycobacteriales bacterium]|nr:glycosyltransferase family 4 protein [Mycobacteriales bacterium]
MRVAVLWSRLAGFWTASLQALDALDGVDVFVAYRASPNPWAPYGDEAKQIPGSGFGWIDPADQDEVLAAVEAFQPDALIVTSWHLAHYRHVLRAFAGRALRIVCMDNQWRGTPRQRLGSLTARRYIQPLYECAFVAGERQAIFARKLGFDDGQILRGLLCADTELFRGAPRTPTSLEQGRSFLFTGRLIDYKGIDDLATAYARYREAATQPWPLLVCGTGTEPTRLERLPGVEMLGFQQPQQLAAVMQRATCLVVPSRYEPWGVVVHEGACAGTSLICTTEVGAAVHLLQDGYNGWCVPTGDPGQLAAAMARMSTCDDEQLAVMSRASQTMAAQLTTDRWARYVRDQIASRIPCG